MKDFLYIAILFISFSVSAQVAIGKDYVDGGGLLDFRDEAATLAAGDVNRGLILPKVDELNNGSVAGTIYLNAANGQVEYRDNTNRIMGMTPSNTAISPLAGPTADNGTGVLISDGSDAFQENAPGVLVLASSNKSLILPKVSNPETNILNPQAGMIVYDTSSKSMAVFNGATWSFWK